MEQVNLTKKISGGCQCGAVRYRVEGALTSNHICHCRMCQKAAGNYFMAFGTAQKNEFNVTRGEISWYQSSGPCRRGFCRDCGTPLIIDTENLKYLHVTLGSLDDPVSAPPQYQVGIESKYHWFDEIHKTPAEISEDDEEEGGAQLDDIKNTSRQHPDYDTNEWPEKNK